MTLVTAELVGACSSGGTSNEESATDGVDVELPGSAPGDIISLRSDGRAVEWIDRRAGTIYRVDDLSSADSAVDTVATIEVSTEGEQRGLLGTTLIDGRRFAAWTDPTTLDLVVGEISAGQVARLVWTGTATQSKAIGGHLDTYAGEILLGLGELTGWATDHGSGALVLLEPDGPATQEPVVLTDDWNNPFAFTVFRASDGSESVWVADNAPDSGPDPERIGRGDTDATRFATASPQRAPSAITMLPDGRLGVCGFLDGQMWAYDATTGDRAGTIGPCLTATTVLDEGTIVTAVEGGLVVLPAV